MSAWDDFFQNEKDGKVIRYRHLNAIAKKGQILFTGSSLMEQFPIGEILLKTGSDKVIYNRGISGYTIPEMLRAMDEQIFGTEPSKIFINIGTNDISLPDETMEKLHEDYACVLRQIRERLPEAEVYLMEYYPINLKVGAHQEWSRAATQYRHERLADANAVVRQLAEEFGFHCINVNEGITDQEGFLREEITMDGIHMWPEAYETIYRNLEKYL